MKTEIISAADWRASQGGKKPAKPPVAAQVRRKAPDPPELPPEPPALNLAANTPAKPEPARYGISTPRPSGRTRFVLDGTPEDAQRAADWARHTLNAKPYR